MSKKVVLIIVVDALLIIGGAIWYFNRSANVDSNMSPQKFYAFDKEKCPGDDRDMKMNDVYMRGQLELGEMYKAKMNWYKCNEIAKEDLVLYRFSGTKDPVVRRVVAVPGDKISILYDKTAKAWSLTVNEEVVTDGENPYFFGGDMPPPLKLYEQAQKGVMGEAEVILFSSFPPGFNDSGTFGAIAIQDVVAKVERNNVEGKK